MIYYFADPDEALAPDSYNWGQWAEFRYFVTKEPKAFAQTVVGYIINPYSSMRLRKSEVFDNLRLVKIKPYEVQREFMMMIFQSGGK